MRVARRRTANSPRPVFERAAVAVAGHVERHPEIRAGVRARVRAVRRRPESPAPIGGVELRHGAVAVQTAVQLSAAGHGVVAAVVFGRQPDKNATVHRFRFIRRSAEHVTGFAQPVLDERRDRPVTRRRDQPHNDVAHAERVARRRVRLAVVRARCVPDAVQDVARQ